MQFVAYEAKVICLNNELQIWIISFSHQTMVSEKEKKKEHRQFRQLFGLLSAIVDEVKNSDLNAAKTLQPGREIYPKI